MKKYYQAHPERRLKQGEVFRRAWREGKHTQFFNKLGNVRYQHSSGEAMMFNAFANEFGEHRVRRCCLYSESDASSRCVYPDVMICGHWVIEYYGDYFHANPSMYAEDDDACYQTAREV